MADSQKSPYPKSVIFIICDITLEMVCYHGVRTVLIMYLTAELQYTEIETKAIFHTFIMLVALFAVIGAIIADSWLGKFNTILYVSIIYLVGGVVLTVSAMEFLDIPHKILTLLGLFLFSIGGGRKACSPAFGGDQYILPQQDKELGSIVCCWATFYIIKQPEGNVVTLVLKCITHAIIRKMKSNESRPHWLDYAEEKYGTQMIEDIKNTLHILYLLIPLPVFWALFVQQGSVWVLQAVRMDGDMEYYTILPDQMQISNPLLILIFIPTFTYVIYPSLTKLNLLKTSLQRMICGGFLAAGAFVVSGFVSLAIEHADPVLPSSGNIQIRIYNPSECSVSVIADAIPFKSEIEAFNYAIYKGISFNESKNVEFDVNSNCFGSTIHQDIPISESNAYGIYIRKSDIGHYVDDVAKSLSGPFARTFDYNESPITYRKRKLSVSVEPGDISAKTIPESGVWSIESARTPTAMSVEFKCGGTYAVMINKDWVKKVVVTKPNTVHILWLLPQYIVLTAGEVMFSLTGLEFAYSQAPGPMKSMLQACWIITTAIGNLLIIIIESIRISDKMSNNFFLLCWFDGSRYACVHRHGNELQSLNFFLYTGLMVTDMLFFLFLAMRYKYVEPEE